MKKLLIEIYNFFSFVIKVIQYTFKKPFETETILAQMDKIGTKSLLVISLTSLFAGMVMSLQTGYASQLVVNEPVYVGTAVSFSMFKELGPVLTALVLTGRIGSAIASEIGTMKVTEQIDALYTLGAHPIKYLAIPRFLSCLFMLPLLTIYACALGILGGYIVCVSRFDVPAIRYWQEAFDYLRVEDLFHGFLKSFFFGALIALISCYKGFECSGGAEGVGKNTTSSVVTTLVSILVLDYFLSAALITLGIG